MQSGFAYLELLVAAIVYTCDTRHGSNASAVSVFNGHNFSNQWSCAGKTKSVLRQAGQILASRCQLAIFDGAPELCTDAKQTQQRLMMLLKFAKVNSHWSLAAPALASLQAKSL